MRSDSSARPPLRRAAGAALALGLAVGLAPRLAAADDVPPEAVVGVVPFANDVPYRVYVDLAPEGNTPLIWMLDTGANASVMTPLAARNHHISVRRLKSTPYVRKTRLGHDVHFYIDTRRSDTRSTTGWEYALLGGEFLEEFVVEIDFPGRRVRFLDPKKYRVPETATGPDESVTRMRVTGKRPSVEVSLHGKEVWAMFDTGAPDNLILSGPAATALGIEWKSAPAFGNVGTTVGPMAVRLDEAEGVQLAGFTYPTMPVIVAPRGWYNIAGNTDSVIGYEAMRPFVVRLDYRRGRLWMKRTAELAITYLGVPYAMTRSSGAFLEPLDDGHYRVVDVRPESPAAHIGIRPGDVPVAPAGEPFTIEGFLADVAKGAEVTVARQQDDVWVDTILPDPLAETP